MKCSLKGKRLNLTHYKELRWRTAEATDLDASIGSVPGPAKAEFHIKQLARRSEDSASEICACNGILQALEHLHIFTPSCVDIVFIARQTKDYGANAFLNERISEHSEPFAIDSLSRFLLFHVSCFFA